MAAWVRIRALLLIVTNGLPVDAIRLHRPDAAHVHAHDLYGTRQRSVADNLEAMVQPRQERDRAPCTYHCVAFECCPIRCPRKSTTCRARSQIFRRNQECETRDRYRSRQRPYRQEGVRSRERRYKRWVFAGSMADHGVRHTLPCYR